jgi:hypothetical protein
MKAWGCNYCIVNCNFSPKKLKIFKLLVIKTLDTELNPDLDPDPQLEKNVGSGYA